MTSCHPRRSSGTRSIASVAKSMRSAWPSAPSSDASWSSSPVSAPTQSFSTREQSFASSTRSGSSAPATPSRARHSAVSSAAEEDSPEPRGTSPVKRDAGRHELDAGGGELGHDAARERAPALGRLGAGEREGVGLAEVLRDHLDAVAVERLRRGGDAAVDRERQREAAVVVRVLPDQVDAAGAARANRRCRDRRRRRCRCRGHCPGRWHCPAVVAGAGGSAGRRPGAGVGAGVDSGCGVETTGAGSRARASAAACPAPGVRFCGVIVVLRLATTRGLDATRRGGRRASACSCRARPRRVGRRRGGRRGAVRAGGGRPAALRGLAACACLLRRPSWPSPWPSAGRGRPPASPGRSRAPPRSIGRTCRASRACRGRGRRRT